eukprot:NODE_2784_length_2146_cov_3.500248.p1 GENE.NODE_2784_length_2146_cov_3.500248~~NODE_2784_length_2146_cov_3.500248.p1  ORF type:complete len:676 (-),score=199.37 NODE_2784_length_2146_cov_3.500248:55-2082(-)
MEVVVVAGFEDFDETLDKRVRGPGRGRKHATQALVHHLASQPVEVVRKVDLLILDWKTPPKQGPKETKVSLHRGASQKDASWGSREQLCSKFPSNVWDIAISTQTVRLVLDMVAQLKVKRRFALAYDYNLPYGPWGQEQTAEQLKEHAGLCEKFEFLCASQHLAEYVEKWSDGACRAQCSYAADYGYFLPPVPVIVLRPWEAQHSYVTFVSPCPEKGLCVFLRLAELLPMTQFLAIKSAPWTKPWYEQAVRKLPNVRIQAASEKIDEILGVTRVLIVPSVSQEAFSLLTLEAQLRGIPVVSTDAYGLAESNRVPSTVVADVAAVYDQRTRELVLGMTLTEAESMLAPTREGVLTMPQWRQAAVNQENFQKFASEEDVQRFANVLQSLTESSESALQQASQDARLAAGSFVDSRQGRFVATLRAALEEHIAAGDAKPAAASHEASRLAGAQVPKQQGVKLDIDESGFDCDQDFTKDENFDGMALAASCLVRLCEQGNLAVAAELLMAKADINQAESQLGVTPLIGAANAGHLDVCKYLLRKAADINVPVADGTLRTPLHAAAQMGFASVVQLLLEKGSDPRAEDLTKCTALILATRGGHLGGTELLLKHKANPNQADEQGQVAINDAVAKDRFDLVTKLLEHGALVNVRNMAGLEAISFSRTPAMQGLIMKRDINF